MIGVKNADIKNYEKIMALFPPQFPLVNEGAVHYRLATVRHFLCRRPPGKVKLGSSLPLPIFKRNFAYGLPPGTYLFTVPMESWARGRGKAQEFLRESTYI